MFAFALATTAAFAAKTNSRSGLPTCDKDPNTNPNTCSASANQCCILDGVTYDGDYHP